MSNEERCAPIRNLLDGLNGQPAERSTRCGGAIVPVTLDTWMAIARRHDVDLILPIQPPAEGSFDARVACTSEVLTARGVGGLVQLATCARCAGVESTVRKMLAEVAAKAGT